jgi:hypothetical protein
MCRGICFGLGGMFDSCVGLRILLLLRFREDRHGIERCIDSLLPFIILADYWRLIDQP